MMVSHLSLRFGYCLLLPFLCCLANIVESCSSSSSSSSLSNLFGFRDWKWGSIPRAGGQKAQKRSSSSSSSSSLSSVRLALSQQRNNKTPPPPPRCGGESSRYPDSQETPNNFISSASSPNRRRGGRRACGFYLWDAPSALLYQWCHHLQRDCIYEGRGGHKFVRVEPGSVLQLLYPCSRYSPDKCIFCGGTFHDHLLLWWSPNLYTPFDMHLERTRASALNPPTSQSPSPPLISKATTGAKRPMQTGTTISPMPPTAPQYGFHRRYVLDGGVLETFLRNQKKSVLKSVPKTMSEIQHSILDNYNLSLVTRMEIHRILIGPDEDHPDHVVSYIVPARPFRGSRFSRVMLQCTRSLVLFWLDRFIMLQEEENARLLRRTTSQNQHVARMDYRKDAAGRF